MTNAIPPPPLDGAGGDEFHREDDKLAHPERPDHEAPEAEPPMDRPNSESDRGLDGFK
jgi:hypothetical protein